MGRTVSVKLMLDIGQYMTAGRRAAVAAKELGGEIDKAAKGGKIEQVSSAATGLGLGLLGAAGAAVKLNADFDKAMSGVRAATHAGAGDMNQLRAAALQAGKDTSYSATEAAGAITELSKAGVSTADVLGGGLKGALSLAAAGQLDVGEAAETAASAMTQFKLSGKDIPHIADLLAAGAGKAQGSVHDIGQALSQSGLVASQFGLSIEDATGTLAAFASAGLIGSDAGTSFKTMLLALANPTSKSRDMMADLGIAAYDAQGKFVGITNLAGQLHDKLQNLTQAQRDSTLAQIFGTDAIRAANVLYTQGSQGISTWIDKVNKSGYAAQTAQIQTDNLAGDVERLKGSLETLAIESGGGANNGLRVMTKTTGALVDQIGNLPPVLTGSLTVLAGVGGAATLAAVGWMKARKASAEFRTQLESIGPAGERASRGIQTTVRWAGRAAAAFGVMQIAAAAISSATNDLNPQIDALGTGLQNFSSTGKLSGESARLLGGDMSKLDTAMKDIADTGRWSSFARGFGSSMESISGTGHAFDDSLTNSRERLQAVDQALQQLVQGGNAAQAAQIFQTIADRAAKQGVSVNELKKVLPGYAASLETAGSATSGTAKKTAELNAALDQGTDKQKDYGSATSAAAAASRGQRDALSALANFMKAETDPVFGLIDAENSLKKAQDAASKAIRQHGKNSVEARAATRDLALAAIELQNRTGALSSSFDGKMTPALMKTLHAAGLTDAEIRILQKQFVDAKNAADKYDGNYEAKTSAPGAKQAKTDLDKAYTAANHFAGPYKANVTVTNYADAIGKLNRLSVYQQALKTGKIPAGFNGPIKGPDGKYYADGGPVDGWSPNPRADNIPAWLTANEWVHPVAAVEHYGPQFMHAVQHRQFPRAVATAFASGRLGAMGDLPIPGLADGGPVLWRFPVTAAHTRIPSQSEVESKVGGQAGPFLRAQDGKPYIWASAGPRGYDCSGIASAVYELLHGRSPYHHVFSTASLPGHWFPKPGVGGPLTVAWSNPGEPPASSTTGHMMGMAGGLTFESTGSRGVHLGRTTRRLTDFAHIAHYGLGGQVAMKNGGIIAEPIFGVGASGRTYSFGEHYMPERVTPYAGGGGHSSTTVVLENHGVIGSAYELETWLTKSIDNLRIRGRI